MKARLTALALLAATPATAQDEMTLMLDWIVNPDHGPIIIAQEQGYFADGGLEVEVIAPRTPPIRRSWRRPAAGRPPVPLAVMLRVYCLQQWYALSDPAAEEALHDNDAIRRFAGLELGDDHGRTTMLDLATFWSGTT